MGLFSNILEKLGLKKTAAEETPKTTATHVDSRPAPATPAAKPSTTTKIPPKPSMQPTGVMPTSLKGLDVGGRPDEMPMVDVVSKLEKMAASNPQKLDWKKSIVDLLKLLGIDSSLAARKELATELGCPAEKMQDSAEMNMWLHKTVLKKIAENGGNIPRDLLD